MTPKPSYRREKLKIYIYLIINLFHQYCHPCLHQYYTTTKEPVCFPTLISTLDLPLQIRFSNNQLLLAKLKRNSGKCSSSSPHWTNAITNTPTKHSHRRAHFKDVIWNPPTIIYLLLNITQNNSNTFQKHARRRTWSTSRNINRWKIRPYQDIITRYESAATPTKYNPGNTPCDVIKGENKKTSNKSNIRIVAALILNQSTNMSWRGHTSSCFWTFLGHFLGRRAGLPPVKA